MNLAHAKFTAYFFTSDKVYTNTTDAGTPNVVLATAADLLLAGGATILPNLYEGDVVVPGGDDDDAEEVGGAVGVADPSSLGYDMHTGNHYGHGQRLHGHSRHQDGFRLFGVYVCVCLPQPCRAVEQAGHQWQD